MNDPNHIKLRNRAKQPVKLTRRQFVGLLGVFGAGTGALCGGVTATSLIATRVIVTTPTQSPTNIPTTPTPIVEKPVVVDRATWGALQPNINARNEKGYYNKETNPEGWYIYPDRLQAVYQTLVVHHSAFYEGDGKSTLAEVQRAHHEDRGWADVGYHFMIDKDGTIYEGRDLTVRGAHVSGYNTGSVGVCMFGDFRFEAPSQDQLNALYALNNWLVFRLQLTHLTGHQQFNDWTECPGTFILTQLEDIATRAGLIFGTDGYESSARADSCCCGCQTAM
jgi:hypothetical protein